jgi:hypothetical protein
MDPLGILNTLLSLRSPRTPRITGVEWAVKQDGEAEKLGLVVTVVNDNQRPIKVASAGTMHTPGTFNIAGVEGLPLELSDGQDAQLFVMPLDPSLEPREPVRVWVETAAGKRAVQEIPPRPSLSSGDNSNGDI